MAVEYYDAYLKRHAECEEMETRAYAEVDELDPDSTFTTADRDKLMIFKNYQLVCMDNQSEPGDLYAEKYKLYSGEFDSALAQARVNAADADDTLKPPLISTVPLGRA